MTPPPIRATSLSPASSRAAATASSIPVVINGLSCSIAGASGRWLSTTSGAVGVRGPAVDQPESS